MGSEGREGVRFVARVAATLALASCAALASACGPPWQVVSQASPSPFRERSSFSIAKPEFVTLGVGESSERGYLDGKDADARAEWARAKSSLVDAYTKGLEDRAKQVGVDVHGAKDAFVVVTAIKWIQPGFYSPTAATASRVKVTVNVSASDGTLLDAIEIEHGTAASAGHDSVKSRLESDGAELGAIVAEYLRQRARPGG